MKKGLRRLLPRLYWFDDGDTRKGGANPRMTGDCSGLYGNCSALSGNCTGVMGDCTDVWGNLDICDLSNEEREEGVNIKSLLTNVSVEEAQHA